MVELQHLNFDQNYKTSRNMTYYGKTIRMDKNPIKTVFNVCDKLIDKRVSLQTKLPWLFLPSIAS